MQHGAGEDHAEDRPGARRPEQTGGDTDHHRTQRAGHFAGVGVEAIAQQHERACQPAADPRRNQRQGKQRHHDQGHVTTGVVGLHHPFTADHGQAGDQGEGQDHAAEGEQDRGAGAVDPGEQERHDREDAGTEDGQNAAQESDEKHGDHL
ncbi:hypothetical protein D3C84_579990 [compost metagenome]